MSVADVRATTAVVWDPPAAVRGALAVIAGGGESARVYERFGRRISADGYRLAVFETVEAPEALAWVTAQDATPRVLVGSDVGASAVLALLNEHPDAVDGAILAGTPVGGPATVADPSARTACPLHRGVLGEDDARARTTAEPVEAPADEVLSGIVTPVLAVHGGSDPIVPFDAASAYLQGLPRAELLQTVDGLHDALNDASHRSVAAHVVLWLERLRGGDVDAPIVRPVASA